MNLVWAITDIFWFFSGSPSGIPSWVPAPAQAVLVALDIAFRLQSALYIFRIYKSLLEEEGVLYTAAAEFTVTLILFGIGSGVAIMLALLEHILASALMVLCFEAVAIVLLFFIVVSLSPNGTKFLMELEITIIYLYKEQLSV